MFFTSVKSPASHSFAPNTLLCSNKKIKVFFSKKDIANALVVSCLSLIFLSTSIAAHEQHDADVIQESEVIQSSGVVKENSATSDTQSTSGVSTTTTITTPSPRKKSGFGRLRSDNPNYFALANTEDDDTLEEDMHIEFYLSLQYPLIEEWFTELKHDEGSRINRMIPNRALFIYNGLFDFYVFEGERYESAPIISRLQNPGLALEWDLKKNALNNTYRKIRIAWFHESNGQTLDDEDGMGAAQFAVERDDRGEEYALSQVSRGWDYLSLHFENASNKYIDGNDDPYGKGWWRYQIELRQYCDCQGFGLHSGREDDIFWETVIDQPQIKDFDGFRLSGEMSLSDKLFDTGKYVLARLDLKTGINGFDAVGNISGRLSLGVAVENTRFTLFYHNGYGKDLSTYHIRTNYYGFGVELR